MADINLLPQDDSTNGWNNILPARIPNPPLTDTVSTDWVVIGAGFAGLAAASLIVCSTVSNWPMRPAPATTMVRFMHRVQSL